MTLCRVRCRKPRRHHRSAAAVHNRHTKGSSSTARDVPVASARHTARLAYNSTHSSWYNHRIPRSTRQHQQQQQHTHHHPQGSTGLGISHAVAAGDAAMTVLSSLISPSAVSSTLAAEPPVSRHPQDSSAVGRELGRVGGGAVQSMPVQGVPQQDALDRRPGLTPA